MRGRTRALRVVLGLGLAAVAALAAGAMPARGADHSGHETGAEHRTGTERISLSIPDVPVLDQDGRPHSFYSDLVRGKVVAVNFLYTSCTTACPLLGVAFAGVQERLGERVGRDVHLISITTDPATDRPARLKAWAARYQARPGWTLVTGARPDIVRLLRALGVSAADKEDHPTFVLIGDDRRGEWSRAWGLLPAAALTPLLERALTAGRPAAHAGHRR